MPSKYNSHHDLRPGSQASERILGGFRFPHFRLCVIVSLLQASLLCRAQSDTLPATVFHRIDSVALSDSRAAVFGELYVKTLYSIEKRMYAEPTADRRFILEFEKAFIHEYLVQSDAQAAGTALLPAWHTYFTTGKTKPIALQLVAINAHINHDFGKVLIERFPYDSIMRHRKALIHFQKAINPMFAGLMKEAASESVGINMLTSFGPLSRWVVQQKINHWRKRQLRLALLHFTHPYRAAVLRRSIERKKKRMDALLLRMI